MDPSTDGINHINVYSAGKTQLGRFLSNFSDCHVQTEDGYFRTIEGYWYWLSTNHEPLRNFPGWQCKKVGRSLGGKDWLDSVEFEGKICRAIAVKVLSDLPMKEALKQSTLPFFHYYVYNHKVIMVKDGLWIIRFIDHLRDELKRGLV
jgi:hypothetical protein